MTRTVIVDIRRLILWWGELDRLPRAPDAANSWHLIMN